MTICPVCALTGRIVQIAGVTTIHADQPATYDWYCPTCHTTGHHPTLGS